MTIPINIIDGNLLAKANRGDPSARQLVLKHAITTLRPLANDDAIGWLLPILEKIAAGMKPADAFPSKYPTKNLEHEQWTMARWVETLTDEHGYNYSLEDALAMIGDLFPNPDDKKLSGPDGGTVARAWQAYKDIKELPMDAILTPQSHKRIAAFEERIQHYLDQYAKDKKTGGNKRIYYPVGK